MHLSVLSRPLNLLCPNLQLDLPIYPSSVSSTPSSDLVWSTCICLILPLHLSIPDTPTSIHFFAAFLLVLRYFVTFLGPKLSQPALSVPQQHTLSPNHTWAACTHHSDPPTHPPAPPRPPAHINICKEADTRHCNQPHKCRITHQTPMLYFSCSYVSYTHARAHTHILRCNHHKCWECSAEVWDS